MIRIAICVCMLLPFFAAAQTTFTTTATGGDWDTGSTWQGGATPSGPTPIIVINGDVTLDSRSTVSNYTSVTINNGKNLTRGTTGNSTHLTIGNVPTFTVSNGNITVYGDLTLSGTTALTITSGNLDVRGKIDIKNGASLTFNSSGTLKAASFETSGSGGSMTVNSGTMTITGQLKITSGGTVTTGASASSTIGSVLTSNSTDAKLVNGGTTTVTGQLEYGGVITNSGTLALGSLKGNGSGGSALTNSGTLQVSGDVTMQSSSTIQLNPSSQMLVYGGLTVTSGAAGGGTEVITVGTNASPPPYADLAIKGNVSLSSGGDIEIQQNGRYANFGTLTSTGDGNFQVDNGGQAYVGGNISLSGGSDVTNGNTTNPWGLYYNGTNSGSGLSSNSANAATMNTTNPVFAAWVNSVFNTLPIELVSFNISAINNQNITISWTTSLERNVDEFIVEKSIDGDQFSTVYSRKATNGGTYLNSYTFTDYEPIQGRNYYRLKTVDYDGTIAYSSIITALYRSENSVVVYPNPAKNNIINLHVNFAPLDSDYITVLSNQGVQVFKGSVENFRSEMAIENMSPGLYHVLYVSEGFQQNIKVVVE